MNKEIKEKFPKWCEDTSENYGVVMSDDLDSLMCYLLQKKMFNREVSHFFFANGKKPTQILYKANNSKYDFKQIIALDCAFEMNMKCWDNHIVKIKNTDSTNENSANLNRILNIKRNNTLDKACISSFITMLSYYEVDISNWTKDQLAVLCSIDGLYCPIQNYKSYPTVDLRKIHRKNLIHLDYEFLADFIEENLEYILKLKEDLGLEKKIYVNKDGKLETDIKINQLSEMFKGVFQKVELPQKEFIEKREMKKELITVGDYSTKENIIEKGNVFNFALVLKNHCVVSYY